MTAILQPSQRNVFQNDSKQIKDPANMVGKWVFRCANSGDKSYTSGSPIKILAVAGPKGYENVVYEHRIFYSLGDPYIANMSSSVMGKVREISYQEDARYWLENQCSGNEKVISCIRKLFSDSDFPSPVVINSRESKERLIEHFEEIEDASEKIVWILKTTHLH